MNLTFDCSLPRLVFILAITLFPLGPTLSAAPSETLTFEADIRPIFREHCFDCHGATNGFEGGLDLRQLAGRGPSPLHRSQRSVSRAARPPGPVRFARSNAGARH